LLNAKQTAKLLHHLHHHKDVIAKLEQLQNVEQELPALSLDAETTKLHNVTLNVLQTHVIVKKQLLINVEINQPVELPHVETTKFKLAELSQNVISNQEDVEKIVTIKSNVPSILATLQPENANTLLITTNVTMEIHVPLTDVLLKDAYIPKKIALITMHVPETSVMQLLENVLLHQYLAHPPTVKLENAIQRLDAPLPTETVMITTLVPLMFAVKIVVATILLMINCVTITILVPLTHALLRKENVSTKRSLVTITTHVPMMFVSTENANSSMHVKIATNALFPLVIL